MQQNIKHICTKTLHWFMRHKTLVLSLLCLALLAPVVAVGLAYALIAPSERFVIPANDQAAVQAKHIKVGLVLGAGITKQGKPFRELQARLDVAATALQKGEVSKLLLSGDNRYKGYNEPKAMEDYLVQVKHIDAARLQLDYAGRSTYESCERAGKVFGQQQVIIFSAASHLPRAIYLCQHLGVTAYGVPSGVEANNAWRREVLARVKAVFNVYVRGENTLLGVPIHL